MTPSQIAAAYAALKPHRECEYVGGGRIQVRVVNGHQVPPRYVTTREAAAAVARAA